jgi:hypothetical protein
MDTLYVTVQQIMEALRGSLQRGVLCIQLDAAVLADLT